MKKKRWNAESKIGAIFTPTFLWTFPGCFCPEPALISASGVCMHSSESIRWHWWQKGRRVTACVTLGPRSRLDAGLNWLWRRPIKSMGLGHDTQGVVGQSRGWQQHWLVDQRRISSTSLYTSVFVERGAGRGPHQEGFNVITWPVMGLSEGQIMC